MSTGQSMSSHGMNALPVTVPRVMVLWCSDWPITAASQAHRLAADAPIALITKGLVFASSAAARAEGVKRGQRQREAQARSPGLVVLDYDPDLDNRAFEPVIAGLEQLTLGVQVLRPGMCALKARGVSRYYGGEKAAALALAGRMDELSAENRVRAGIADGIFTAEQAAHRTGQQRVRIVPAGESAAFLAPLDVGVLQAEIVTLLRRLGIRTLGEFAALAADDVFTRFGSAGGRLHALASGRDSWPVTPRTPPADLDVEVVFEPALDRVDQVAFAVRASADRFIEALTAARLVCTAIRVELESDSDRDGLSERVWLHPRSFTPAEVVDRVRWQLQSSAVIDAGLSAGIIRVRIAPEAVDAIGHHETGLWGSGPDERIHHGLSRVQSMLGHEAVLVPSVGGGRTLADRQHLVAWGDRALVTRRPSEPWPGQVPSPLPGTVFSPRRAVHVFAANGESITVDARGRVSAPPARFAAGRTMLAITAWAGPWPLDERWWSADARRAYRFQAVDSSGCGWLLVLDDAGWWAEARYD